MFIKNTAAIILYRSTIIEPFIQDKKYCELSPVYESESPNPAKKAYDIKLSSEALFQRICRT